VAAFFLCAVLFIDREIVAQTQASQLNPAAFLVRILGVQKERGG
jgi:hypothetical protein